MCSVNGGGSGWPKSSLPASGSGHVDCIVCRPAGSVGELQEWLSDGFEVGEHIDINVRLDLIPDCPHLSSPAGRNHRKQYRLL